jgi:CPA1 family monovalent cation:H+ antiporter
MIHELQLGIGLLAVVAAATLVARSWQVPASILLVAIGICLSFVPHVPNLRLDPDIVLLVILPPLIYSAGVATSWPDFRRDLRPITLLAIGAVLFTTVVIAAGAHVLLGLPWASAVLLGAIVSPPDVIAPMTIVSRIPIPRRLVTILNGEGLVNDVTALVLVALAITAVMTGDFSAPRAAVTFVLVLAGELAWGLLLGWAGLRLRNWARDVRVEITLALLTPYAAFWLPHELGGSGVLATAVVGLYASWTGPHLISAATRLQGTFFWNLVIYLLNGLVFLLTGLQARSIVEKVDVSAWLIVEAVAIWVIAALARFAWVYVSPYVPLLAIRHDRPRWEYSFLVGFTGIRGVVSLVAAFSIPLTRPGGEPFPGRDLIVFLTFAVIVATLVVQGLALPQLIRRLGLSRAAAEEAARDGDAELEALAAAQERAIERLEPEAARVGAPEPLVADLRRMFERRHRRAKRMRYEPEADRQSSAIELALVGIQRDAAWENFTSGAITDEARRRIEHDLDLEEARIRRSPNEAVADGT